MRQVLTRRLLVPLAVAAVAVAALDRYAARNADSVLVASDRIAVLAARSAARDTVALPAQGPFDSLAQGKPFDLPKGLAQGKPASDAAARRAAMVDRQIRARGVADPAVLAAMRKIPRERFVPGELGAHAYDDSPLPIGHGQTISQPFIVAYMTEVLGVERHHTVLEIGTGSGYQAAVLAELAKTVYTIEIVPELARGAAATLKALGYTNVHVRAGDGYAGWPEHAPFDRILVTAAPEEIPKPLIEQLGPGGRLVAPVGAQGRTQWMTIVDKTAQGLTERRTIPVQFVPFVRSR